MKVGDIVPDFELPDETGTTRRLSDLVSTGPVVLYFYPAAMTPGCTKESCHFRDVKGDARGTGRPPGGHQRRSGGEAAAVHHQVPLRLPVVVGHRSDGGQDPGRRLPASRCSATVA